MGTVLIAGPAQASHPEVSLTGSNFEIDTNANLKVDDTGQTPASLDWANVAETRKADKTSGTGDDSFGNGSKEDTPIPSVVSGSIPPNKSDLLNFGAYLEDAGADDFLHLFWHRVQEPTGTTNMDFEFNQKKAISTFGNGITPERTEGDILIQYDLAQGGTNPKLFVAYWLTDTTFREGQATEETVSTADCVSSNSFPCWGLRADLTAAGDATGSINTSAIPANESDGLGAVSARTFGEATVDFTAITGGGCAPFGSAYLKSRSSDSFTAALKDFIAPVEVNLSNCATVKIRKQTDPDQSGLAAADRTSFGFTKSFATLPATGNTFSLTDEGVQQYVGTVPFGTGFTVAETSLPTGWKLSNVDCSASSGVTPQIAANGTVTFSLDSGLDVLDCTYNNETGGTVIVRKVTDPNPDTSASDFGFTTNLDRLSGSNDPSFSLKNGGSQTYDDVLIGSGYTIDESTVPSGWDLESIDCSASTDVSPVIDVDEGTVTFAIDDASDILDCTYGNETGGTVIIHKVTQPSPDGSDTSFGYSTSLTRLTGATDPAFSLKDGEQQTYSDVLLGTGLTVTEDSPLPTGWELVDVDCDASVGVTPTSITGGTVTFDIDDADDVLECTYTNRASGSITIEKITTSGTGAFDFESNTLSPAEFTLTTSAAGSGGKDTKSFSDLDPGTYDVSEIVPANWNLVSATCDDGSDPASIGLSAGENITCTFTNDREVGAIEITKLRKHAEDGLGENHPHENVDFVITGGELPPEGITVTTDATGVACATGLLVSGLAGLYTITETLPDGYAAVGTQTANVTEAADCDSANAGAVKEFVNTPLTDIHITVDSLVAGGTFSSIDCYVTGAPDGVIEKDGITELTDDLTLDLTDLEPQNITCDFVIDP